MAEEQKNKSTTDECTFKPQLKAKYQSVGMKDRSPERRNPEKIFEELYKKRERKEDVKTEDREYEKNLKELTFKPTINARKSSARVTQT